MSSHFSIDHVRANARPVSAGGPARIEISEMSASVSAAGLDAVIAEAVKRVAARLPVDVEIGSSRLTSTGVDITARVKKSFLKAELTARIDVTAKNAERVRVRFAGIDGPPWVPSKMLIDQALAKALARPGVSRAEGVDNAVDIDPRAVLSAYGVPGDFSPDGAWSVASDADAMVVSFA